MVIKKSKIFKKLHWKSFFDERPHLLLPPRVLTGAKSGSQCSKFSEAEPGSVWNKIFKKHMMENESCIGKEKASKQMQETNELLTMFYYSYGKEPCNVKVLWKNPAFNHMSVALSKGIYVSGLLLCLEISLVFLRKVAFI